MLPSGEVIVVDAQNQRVRKMALNGTPDGLLRRVELASNPSLLNPVMLVPINVEIKPFVPITHTIVGIHLSNSVIISISNA